MIFIIELTEKVFKITAEKLSEEVQNCGEETDKS